MSPNVTVHLPAYIARHKGRSVFQVEMPPGSLVRDLLLRLSTECDSRFADLVEKGTAGNLWINNLLLTGRRLELPRDLPLQLNDNDDFCVMYLIGGG